MGAPTPRARIVKLLLAALLVWSVALRVWLATEGLAANHYWDERYNVRNVRQVVVAGDLEPVSYYYTALSYLPQAALLAVSQRIARVFDPGFSWFDDRDLRPAGYLICRLVQIAYGAGSIVLTFVIGRRLFSPEVGLLAALLLASSPVHVRLSTFFKPDILLVFMVLLALWLALRAAAAPTWRRYVLAGAGVGLALSSKLNGGPIALPLVLAATTQSRRDRSQLFKLAAAGVAAVAVFLLFNPHVDRYLQALSRNQDIYARSGQASGTTSRTLQVLRQTAEILASPTFHGVAVGVLAGAGALLLVTLAVRRRSEPDRVLPWARLRRHHPTPPGERLAWLMLLVFPIGYTVIYAIATGYAKPNNFLPILPMSSLLAAFFALALWSGAARQLRALDHPATRGLAAALLAVLVAYPAQAFVYTLRTRSTWDVAFDQVAAALKPWEGRVAHFEQVPSGLGLRPRPLRAMVRRTPRLDVIAAEDLDQMDAAVFAPSAAAGGAGESFAQRWRDLGGSELMEVRPRLFRTHGPDVTVALRAPRLLSATRVPPRADAREPSPLPLDAPPSTGELVSVSCSLPRGAPAPRLRHGPLDVELVAMPLGRTVLYLSRRIRRCPGDDASLELVLDRAAPAPAAAAPPARGRVEIVLYRFAADCSSPAATRASEALGAAADGAQAGGGRR